MNKFLLASVSSLVVVIATQAGAADLPVKYRAPMAVEAGWSWTGFYIGGHFGGGFGTKEWTEPSDSSFPGFSDASGTMNGLLGGVQAGFNYQFAPHWMFGVEGDFSASNLKGTYGCFNNFNTFNFGGDSCSSKADWFATLTGRFGATVDHALLYFKGGAAWAHDSYTDTFVGDGTSVWTSSQTRFGYTVGAGIEYAIDRNWSAKLEYDYMDFGNKRTDFVSNFGDTYHEDIAQRVHVVKAGINYRFDWAGPVVAKY